MSINASNLPLVSFVIPTHNRAELLRKCLDSVINQTYKNLEVIVIDDNSTDKTSRILEEYSNRDTAFKYYKNDGVGGNAARNLGVRLANGDYIAFMDDDDICEPFRISEQMKPVIESNFKYDFVISSFTFYSKGKKVDVVDYLKPLDSIGFTVRWLVKKELIIRAGFFDVNQPSLQDVEFFWRLKSLANLYYSKISVVKVMSSDVSVTKNKEKMITGITRLLKLHGDKMGSYEKNHWIILLCKKYASLENWEQYETYFNQLNKTATPISNIVLRIASQMKNNTILKVHSRFTSYYFKYRIKFKDAAIHFVSINKV